MNCGVEHSMEWLECRRDKLLQEIRAVQSGDDNRRARALREEYLRIVERIETLRESIQRGTH